MVGNKQYRRWEYDDETEISVEEQLTLEDHEQTDEMQSTTTFSQPTITMNGSRIHQKRCGKITSINRKVQLIGLSAGVLLVGFIAGFAIGVRDKSPAVAQRNSKHSSSTTPSSTTWSSRNEINESAFHKLVGQITAENIRHNLKRMSQEVHTAGTAEGRAMAMAIRDLWRTYKLSVRVEQHKATLTRTNAFNFIEALDGNGSVIYRSSQVGDDMNLPNRPILAFSPPADLNATLIYGHFGSYEDWKYLESAQVRLNGSIALVRFSDVHPSKIVATAVIFGIQGIIFYPDPSDFGPMMPSAAIRRSSILTLGQIHEYQEHKTQVIPCHTISSNDAEYLFRRMMMNGRKIPKAWQGGLKTLYSLGGVQQTHLRLFNENYQGNIYNVIASIPGAWESDRYVIVGCSHDSWTNGAGDPGVGLAILTEIIRVFASTVQKGWKTRRSILFISWDANLYASSGVSHWLQEHHFEISSRAVAYIDLTRALQGNQTLRVFSTPVLREVAKKAIARVKHFDSITLSSTKSGGGVGGSSSSRPETSRLLSSIEYSSTVNSDEPSFAFLGNLGIPFMKLSFFNSPKSYDYPLFHTSFDTFDNFRRLVDPNFNGSETLGRIISTLIVLLVDSSLLPMNVEDYVEEIQKAFGNFLAQYNHHLHQANLSIAFLQAAVMRLEVIGDNFRTDVTGHNDTLRIIINNEQHEHEPTSHQVKSKKLLFHRIINDKLMGLDRAFLSRKSDVFKHLILGYSSCSWTPSSRMSRGGGVAHENNCSVSYDENYNFHFPKLREALNCGRKFEGNIFDQQRRDINDCRDWKAKASQEVAALIRALDAAAAILQSPLLPEESDSSSA